MRKANNPVRAGRGCLRGRLDRQERLPRIEEAPGGRGVAWPGAVHTQRLWSGAPGPWRREAASTQKEAVPRASRSSRAATKRRSVNCQKVDTAARRPVAAVLAERNRGPDRPGDVSGHLPIAGPKGARGAFTAGEQLR
ncbi:hypothetical protein NDU88_001412 [Pleurodeles waltl]|uniref:Uncharacterized protein n=1 Tax=Pleurodeles waltl TaxID=8319 RepID=A0AAV7R8H8_PLEWA|nr:hypothetical protein NDU88_001412 [Pleurodeles waltl]